jgi:S-adenosylmethionine:tRNA ribosyltransferase-isomerase
MKLTDFCYELAPDRIAQEPVTPRDQSKLMVIDRSSGRMTHTHFHTLAEFLRPGDVLVTNATKVFPARLRGKKKTGGKVEVLLVAPQGDLWKALVRGATRASDLVFPEGLEARMMERSNEGEWSLAFSSNHLREYLDRHGEMPLPPYIKRSAPRDTDFERYQTVYAESEGAVAAPTAGFHFTPELLETVRAKGITVQSIVLHVGWGTFRPVRTESIEKHRMLPESYEVSESTARELNKARKEKRRVIAVGTTAVRTLETVCDPAGHFRSGRGQADLFIYPGYKFKAVDALITNLHLPDSTPLLLACAFFGYDSKNPFSLRPAYEEAIRQGYRFYSYGDAMFIQ